MRAPCTRAIRALFRSPAAILEQQGCTYRSDGALWLHFTDWFGDDKDRVLVRSSGEHTRKGRLR